MMTHRGRLVAAAVGGDAGRAPLPPGALLAYRPVLLDPVVTKLARFVEGGPGSWCAGPGTTSGAAGPLLDR